jgi:surface carbohydrate biosynthesis protein
MRKLKICLVVDNPLRDLDSMILLASHLVSSQIDVYLTTMYDQENQIVEIRPDYILVNYVRPNNKSLLEKIHKAGIRIGVLDTEGGAVIMDLEETLIYMLRNGGHSSVSDFFIWGKKQYEAILKSGLVLPENLYITGTPRYDFCTEPCINIYDHPFQHKNYILVNTNFPFIFPKYQTFAQEIDTFNTLSNFSISDIIKISNEYFSNWSSIIESIIFLANKLDDSIQIVIRPHPFEDEQVYIKVFKNFKNVFIIKEGSVIPWIYHSMLLIHRDCSTAIEASFMNIYAISIEYPQTSSKFRQEVPREVSLKANNLNELFDLVEYSINEKNKKKNFDVNQWVISNWYRAIDGSSSKIISEIILEKIVQNRTNFLKIFYSIFDSNKSKIKFILQKLRIIRLKKNKKEIKLSEVVSMIQRLNNINSKKISCSRSALTKSIRIFEKA